MNEDSSYHVWWIRTHQQRLLRDIWAGLCLRKMFPNFLKWFIKRWWKPPVLQFSVSQSISLIHSALSFTLSVWCQQPDLSRYHKTSMNIVKWKFSEQINAIHEPFVSICGIFWLHTIKSFKKEDHTYYILLSCIFSTPFHLHSWLDCLQIVLPQDFFNLCNHEKGYAVIMTKGRAEFMHWGSAEQITHEMKLWTY